MKYLFESIVLDVDRRLLLRSGQEVPLPPKAFALLLFLIQRHSNAVSKAELMEHLWPDTFVSDATLASLVADVREAIDDRGRAPRMIRTIHRFGYAFIADIQHHASAQPEQPVLGWLIGEGWRLPLHDGEIILGREGEGVMRLPSTSVSRRHAAIAVNESIATVRDLGSKNGTFVNDVRVADPTILRDGARLRFGTLELVYRAATPSSSTVTV